MLIGKIIGSVIATRKHEKLIGNKFMIVEIVNKMSFNIKQVIAVDNIGAGVGDYVLISLGYSARLACVDNEIPVDAAIIGIIDDGARLELL